MYFVHIVSAPTGHIIINYEAVVGCKVVRLTVSNGNGNPVAVMARMRWCFRELDVVVIEFGALGISRHASSQCTTAYLVCNWSVV